MKACNEKLRSALEEAMSLAEAREAKEIADMEPHEFSEEFERKMENLIAQIPTRRDRRKRILRYMAASVAVVFLIGGVLVSRTVTTQASWFDLDIVKWLESFFQVDSGEDFRKDDSVLFEESRIGYLPEGFKKVEEGISFSCVYYQYRNNTEDYINIQVVRDKGMLTSDGTEVLMDEGINAEGYEYQYVQKKDTGEDALIWSNGKEIYYSIISTLDQDEIIKIMNEITY